MFTRLPVVVCALESFVFLWIDVKDSLKCLTNLSSQSFAEISAKIATQCSFFAPPTIVAFVMQEKNGQTRWSDKLLKIMLWGLFSMALFWIFLHLTSARVSI